MLLIAVDTAVFIASHIVVNVFLIPSNTGRYQEYIYNCMECDKINHFYSAECNSDYDYKYLECNQNDCDQFQVRKLWNERHITFKDCKNPVKFFQ